MSYSRKVRRIKAMNDEALGRTILRRVPETLSDPELFTKIFLHMKKGGTLQTAKELVH